MDVWTGYLVFVCIELFDCYNIRSLNVLNNWKRILANLQFSTCARSYKFWGVVDLISENHDSSDIIYHNVCISQEVKVQSLMSCHADLLKRLLVVVEYFHASERDGKRKSSRFYRRGENPAMQSLQLLLWR